jgi:hypothetical protein
LRFFAVLFGSFRFFTDEKNDKKQEVSPTVDDQIEQVDQAEKELTPIVADRAERDQPEEQCPKEMESMPLTWVCGLLRF